MAAIRTSAAGGMGTARWLALAAFLTFAVSGGGRVSGSDEVTMFEVAHAMLRGGIAVPQGATLQGPDGRFYSKNTAGQAILALPLVATGEAAAGAAGFDGARRTLAARFVTSFFNAVITALLLAAFHRALRQFRVGAGAAFATTLLLGFTTPVWVYSKSFMAEPLEGLGLLLALTGAARAGAEPAPGEARNGRWTAALGAFVAISAKLSMLPLTLVCLAAAGRGRLRAWREPVLGVLLALAGHALYNAARFGTPWETGYGAQASAAAFSTPLFVGVYGLLLSSGKGVLWFAPAIALAPLGFAHMLRRRQHSAGPRHGETVQHAALAVLAVWALALVQFGRFQHWAGDGSWGPRYLVPLLPLAFLAVGFALEGASRWRRRLAQSLALLGLVVTLGGVSIHYGAQMREAGDYPYTLPLEHPHFMESSHFDPRFTPIVSHWQMAARNIGLHLSGESPRLGASGVVDPRLGISPDDQVALLHALDYWWLYAAYSGIPFPPLAIAALVVFGLALVCWYRAYQAMRAERAERAERS